MAPTNGTEIPTAVAMTLRDYFVGQALLLLRDLAPGFLSEPAGRALLATRAGQIADALLAERSRPPAATSAPVDALKDALLTLEAINENWGDEHPGLKRTVAEEIERVRAAIEAER
jgi:hypothetical protein